MKRIAQFGVAIFAALSLTCLGWTVYPFTVSTFTNILNAQEVVNLTAPVAPPANTSCRLERLTLEPLAGRIYVQTLGTNGEAASKVYDSTTTPTGASLLSALNTSNNSAGISLIKRIYTRLSADGVCVGTVTGTPQ